MSLPNIINEINTIKSTYYTTSGGYLKNGSAIWMGDDNTWKSLDLHSPSGGASLHLRGGNSPNQPYSFVLSTSYEYEDDRRKMLYGDNTGALIWAGNNVITSAGGTINGTLSIGGSLGVTGEINSTNGNIVATNGIVRGTRLSANNNVNDNIDFVFRHISDGGAYLPGSYARAGEWQQIPTIRGSWYSGINGYQIWSDGLIEQWGFAYAAHGGRFSFHTPFTSGNYCIYFQLENVDAHYIISAYDRQTTSCYTLVYWTTNYGTGTVPCYWYARGF